MQECRKKKNDPLHHQSLHLSLKLTHSFQSFNTYSFVFKYISPLCHLYNLFKDRHVNTYRSRHDNSIFVPNYFLYLLQNLSQSKLLHIIVTLTKIYNLCSFSQTIIYISS